MLDRIIRFSIHNKLIIALFALAIVAWGSYSVSKLNIDAVPDITNNQVAVITTSPSLAAQEVEQLITFQVEMAVSNIQGVEELRSISRFGLSVVTIVFEEDIDIYWARQQVAERLVLLQSKIPANLGRPAMGPVSSGLGEIYQYILKPKKGYESQYSALDLRDIQDWIVRRHLLGTAGVADISSFGGFVKQYEIAVSPDKIRALNVSLPEIFTALEKNNENTGGAYIEKKPNAYFIRSEGLVKSIDDINNIVIKTNPSGVPLLIRHVAEVKLGNAIRYGAMTYNNEEEVVGGIVMMVKGENSAKVIEHVKDRIASVQKSLPVGVEIEPYLDRTKLIDKAIHTILTNLIEGALIVLFVLVLMLGNLRAGLLVASVIPLTMLFAISMMHVFGVSGNLMSLGAIDFGIIVDGAVIVVEATLHHLMIFRRTNTTENIDEEVYHASSKVRSAAAFGEIIILIVYIPLLALVGIEGKMFKPMAQTISFAIIGAFILSLTYVPMMSAWLFKKPGYQFAFSDKMIEFLNRKYQVTLDFILGHVKLILTSVVALFIASVAVFYTLGGEFIPQLDEGDFAIEMRVITGSSMTETIDASLKAADILKTNFPEVEKVVGKVGTSEIPTDPMPIEACDLIVVLKDKSEWTSAKTKDELGEKMAHKLSSLPGVTFGFQQPIQMRFNELMTGARQDVVVKIFGEHLDILAAKASEVARLAEGIEGVEDIYVENISGLPQIVITYKREQLAQYGIDIKNLNDIVQTAFAGKTSGYVYEGERPYEMVVRLQKLDRDHIDDVRNISIPTANGQLIPLEVLADVSFKTGINQVSRENAKRKVNVGFNIRNRDVQSVIEELQKKVDKAIILPPAYYITYGGEFENFNKAKERLIKVVPVALILIFVLLYFTFHSVLQAVLIYTAIPLSSIGGILALWMRDMSFSISAAVGFIALFGIAVLNGIVLISEFNALHKEGVDDVIERIKTGTSTRLRPVLMTALVASLGFLPMAISNSEGAEVQRPLATVVIGGLVSATFLTMYVMPILYLLTNKKKKEHAK